jgi:DNA-binding winged helix-turn-helix (wHTH) protein
MEVRLLGLVEAGADGRAIALGGAKQRAVLAMLALRANAPVSVDQLVEGLWGERPPPSAPKLVQHYVSQLRKHVDGERAEIVTRGRGYELRLPEAAIDALRFERLVTTAAAQNTGRPAPLVRRCRCGAVRRSTTSPTSRSPPPRSAVSRTSGSARASLPSTTPWQRASTRRSSVSCRSWSTSTRCVSACTHN